MKPLKVRKDVLISYFSENSLKEKKCMRVVRNVLDLYQIVLLLILIKKLCHKLIDR